MVKGIVKESEEKIDDEDSRLEELEKEIEEVKEKKERIVKEKKTSVEEEEIPKLGDLIPYAKELEYGVIDEEGNRIPCKSFVEAKILSLLLEMKK